MNDATISKPTQSLLQLRLLGLGLQTRHEHIPNITSGLIEEEAHALTPQLFADDIELDTIRSISTSSHTPFFVSDSLKTYLFSLIIYAIPQPPSIT